MKNDDIKRDGLLGEQPEEKKHVIEEEASFGKDLFIVAGGIVFVVFVFFLYRSLTGLDLDVKFPRFSNVVIDAWGQPLDGAGKKVDPQLIQGFFWIGFICAAVGFFVFLFFTILFKWPKHIKRKLVERKETKTPPDDSTNLS
ncbi:MAG: hypothetical protein P9M07_01530 [Candidatus Aceula meridiana]|nr:hypothetical protein [Candidatus Aceula meridiana]